jgi:nitrous oxidase accessory protein NosD
MRRLLVLLSTLTAGVLFALPAAPGWAGNGGHAAITITSNADFGTCGCVTSGDGSAASPFVIGPWAINAPSGGTSGYSVKIDNSNGLITDYFNITGIASTYNNTNIGDPTIWLVGVTTPTTISGASGNNLGVGVELDNSSNISIDNVSYNKDNGIGVYINGSSNVSINNSKFKSTCNICTPHTGDGIYAVNSSGLQIGTGADCPHKTPCNDLTYDDGWGIYLQNTNDVVINQATADANDTGGYVLDGTGTYDVTLENSGSQGGGSICHTYLGQKLNTGYTTDLQGGLHLINGTHDDTITNDTFANNTTMDIASGGNGFFYNACGGGDQPWTGTVEGPMGANNTFSNICYRSTSGVIPGLPPSTCKS